MTQNFVRGDSRGMLLGYDTPRGNGIAGRSFLNSLEDRFDKSCPTAINFQQSRKSGFPAYVSSVRLESLTDFHGVAALAASHLPCTCS